MENKKLRIDKCYLPGNAGVQCEEHLVGFQISLMQTWTKHPTKSKVAKMWAYNFQTCSDTSNGKMNLSYLDFLLSMPLLLKIISFWVSGHGLYKCL